MDTSASSLETRFFRTLNGFVEPAVRAGFGSPWLWPTGLVVLECTGRRTGRTHRVPVAAARWGRVLVVSTVRAGRSDWLKNLEVTPDVSYWLAGRKHAARAFVFSPDTPSPHIDGLPAIAHPLVPGLALLSTLGMGFAVLTPLQ